MVSCDFLSPGISASTIDILLRPRVAYVCLRPRIVFRRHSSSVHRKLVFVANRRSKYRVDSLYSQGLIVQRWNTYFQFKGCVAGEPPFDSGLGYNRNLTSFLSLSSTFIPHFSRLFDIHHPPRRQRMNIFARRSHLAQRSSSINPSFPAPAGALNSRSR